MSGGNARHVVFDDELLDKSADELRAAYPMEGLRATLTAGLLDREAFGAVDGANEAHTRLQQAFTRMWTELQRAGVDVYQLAIDAGTAAQQARDADTETLRQALQATLDAIGSPNPSAVPRIGIRIPGWTD